MMSNSPGSTAGALSPVLPRSEEWPVPALPPAPAQRRSRPMVLAAAAGRGLLSTLRADPRQAVQEDSIRCLVCGGSFRQLTNTHLRVHRLTADEYKQRFGYNRGRPLMCAELCRLYTDRAVKNGLASRIRERPILVRPELRRRGGTRTIALEELLTRRDVRRRSREISPTL
jgi:hypothetical protein